MSLAAAPPWEQLQAARRDEVLAYILSSVDRFAADAPQAALLRKAIGSSKVLRSNQFPIPYLLTPLMVYGGVAGSDGGTPVVAIAMMIRIGSQLYDDLVDGDLKPEDWPPSDASAVPDAVLALSLIPPRIIADLDIPAETARQMQRLFSDGILKMLAGQRQDVANKNRPEVNSADVERSVVGKTGAGIGLVAGLAATMAGARAEQVQAYMDYGSAMGTIHLLCSDVREMFLDPECRDLKNGTRTLQIALCLEHKPEGEHPVFLDLLDRARNSEQARTEVRKELRKVRFCFPLLNVLLRYRTMAHAALEKAAPQEPYRGYLEQLNGPPTGFV